MTGAVTQLWRHPIKGIGSEALDRASVIAGAPMPGDRAWAVVHEGGADTDEWQMRRTFLVVAYGPRLAQITATSLPDGTLRLTHPDLSDLQFDPATQGADLLAWVHPLWPEHHSPAKRLVRAPAQSMSDHGTAQLSLMNMSSLRAVSQKLGAPLDTRRFRGNLWFDGLAPWEEFDWIGRRVRIGTVVLEITERIERCRATEANPDTGLRDVNPVKALTQGWDHMDFGVLATVLNDGAIAIGDEVTPL